MEAADFQPDFLESIFLRKQNRLSRLRRRLPRVETNSLSAECCNGGERLCRFAGSQRNDTFYVANKFQYVAKLLPGRNCHEMFMMIV